MEKQIENIFDKEKIETPKEEVRESKKRFILFRFLRKLFSKNSNQNHQTKYPISEAVS